MDIGKHVMSSARVKASDATKRAEAVAAALEVIAVRAQTDQAGFTLEHEMELLAQYADLIQEAIEVKANP